MPETGAMLPSDIERAVQNVPLPPGADDTPTITTWWDFDYECRIVYTPDMASGPARVYGSSVQWPDGSIAGPEEPPRVYLADGAPDNGLSLEEARSFAQQILTTVEMLEGWQR